LRIDEWAQRFADPDPEVRAAAREKLLEVGPEALPALTKCASSASPKTRAGLWGILREIHKRQFKSELQNFAANPRSVTLERAALALSGIANPDLDVDSYVAKLNAFSNDLILLLAPKSETEFNLEAFQNFMAGELGFTGNSDDYYNPANSFVDQVIDRRSGIPITLCLIYMVVGSKAGLRVEGVGLPGHFVVRFGEADADIYLDPFHGGRPMTHHDCRRLVSNRGLDFSEEYLEPATPSAIIGRMCRNLAGAFSLRQVPVEAREYSEMERLIAL